MSSESMDLKHQFLIAMPAMADPNFSGSVVYICDHSDNGALGLVINRPTDLSLSTLFDRIDLKLEIAPWKDTLVFFGGPVQTERGFVLHVPPGTYSSTMTVTPELEAVADGSGPEKMLVTLGYSGWGAGQLEGEIAANAWLTVTATPQILFDTPPEARYEEALKLLGVQATQLTGQAGHA
jgi:putative transcriptional regulator